MLIVHLLLSLQATLSRSRSQSVNGPSARRAVVAFRSLKFPVIKRMMSCVQNCDQREREAHISYSGGAHQSPYLTQSSQRRQALKGPEAECVRGALPGPTGDLQMFPMHASANALGFTKGTNEGTLRGQRLLDQRRARHPMEPEATIQYSQAYVARQERGPLNQST